jgi:hypothetical protein
MSQLKLAKTSQAEIERLLDALNEVEWLAKELVRSHLSDIEFDGEDYPMLSKLDKNDPEIFLEQLARHLSGIHFQRILWNALTLLENCADPDLDTLDFSKDIKRGLELLEAENQEPDYDNQARENEVDQREASAPTPYDP